MCEPPTLRRPTDDAGPQPYIKRQEAGAGCGLWGVEALEVWDVSRVGDVGAGRLTRWLVRRATGWVFSVGV
eukprot:220454-Chlamydomonas_euryale.AAC.1